MRSNLQLEHVSSRKALQSTWASLTLVILITTLQNELPLQFHETPENGRTILQKALKVLSTLRQR